MAIDTDLEKVYYAVTQALHPEDIFGRDAHLGLPPEIVKERIGKTYESMYIIADPQRYRDVQDADFAQDARDQLDHFLQIAYEKIENGEYGLVRAKKIFSLEKSFVVGGRKYYLGRKIFVGTHFVFYEGYLEMEDGVGEVLIKLARDVSDNHLIQNEIRILNTLHEVQVPQWKHLPVIMNVFEAGRRHGMVFRKIVGVNLIDVRRDHLYKGGVDQRHMIWVLDRSLSALGYVHNQGVVHGDVCPQNIVIRPSNHNAFIVNWDRAIYKAASTGERLVAHQDVFRAPEAESGRVGPWSDLYSLGKVMIWLLGGDPETNTLPQDVARRVQRFLLHMVTEDISSRPHDAWELYGQQVRLKDSLWEREFLHFEMSSS